MRWARSLMSWRSTIPTTKYPALREGATIVCYLLISGRPMPYTMTMLERRAARYKDRNTPPARKGITTLPAALPNPCRS